MLDEREEWELDAELKKKPHLKKEIEKLNEIFNQNPPVTVG